MRADDRARVAVAVVLIGCLLWAIACAARGGHPALCVDTAARAQLADVQRADMQRTRSIVEAVRALRLELRRISDADDESGGDVCSTSSDASCPR